MKKQKSIIRWVTTPKCKDCTPTADMLRRPGCMGCTKYEPIGQKAFNGVNEK